MSDADPVVTAALDEYNVSIKDLLKAMTVALTSIDRVLAVMPEEEDAGD